MRARDRINPAVNRVWTALDRIFNPLSTEERIAVLDRLVRELAEHKEELEKEQGRGTEEQDE